MKLFPVHSLLWSSLLVLWASQNEMDANNPDVCRDEKYIAELLPTSTEHDEEVAAEIENFFCLLNQTNILNCSWSLHTLPKDAQLFVSISICDDVTTIDYLKHPSEERVGSRSFNLGEHKELNVILQFNITLQDKGTVYTYIYTYDKNMLEALSPPPNISASVNNGDLLVTWGLPHSRANVNPKCFEYQLDMGDQERSRNLSDKLSYTEPNADPSHTYRVRMRTRIVDHCREKSQWSDWSHAVIVEQSTLNTLVIILISLGIPMILLAVLLLLRYQRVSKVLFPPIPGPPPKYIYILEKNDTFNIFHPPSPEPVEEITMVEYTEQNPEKTF